MNNEIIWCGSSSGVGYPIDIKTVHKVEDYVKRWALPGDKLGSPIFVHTKEEANRLLDMHAALFGKDWITFDSYTRSDDYKKWKRHMQNYGGRPYKPVLSAEVVARVLDKLPDPEIDWSYRPDLSRTFRVSSARINDIVHQTKGRVWRNPDAIFQHTLDTEKIQALIEANLQETLKQLDEQYPPEDFDIWLNERKLDRINQFKFGRMEDAPPPLRFD